MIDMDNDDVLLQDAIIGLSDSQLVGVMDPVLQDDRINITLHALVCISS